MLQHSGGIIGHQDAKNFLQHFCELRILTADGIELLKICPALRQPRDHLLKLVLDVLFLGQLQRGKNHFRPFLVFGPLAPLQFLGKEQKFALELAK